MNYQDQIDLLGYRAKDKITGFSGVVSSVCFDLYGCIQVALSPPANDKGEIPEGRWFDVARIEISHERVMSPPSRWATDKGPAEKPAR